MFISLLIWDITLQQDYEYMQNFSLFKMEQKRENIQNGVTSFLH